MKTPDVLKHLATSLELGWERYCRRLRRCQKSFSEEAVHDSRVQTRRLLSAVELLAAFIPDKKLQRARCALKDHLDTFDDLRDTQMQRDYMRRMKGKSPVTQQFSDWLKEREKNFTKKARKAVRCIKTKRLEYCIDEFQKIVQRRRKKISRKEGFDAIYQAMNVAFDRVAQQCRNIDEDDTDTIHQTRIAFKRFRYMVEALSAVLPAVSEQYRHAMQGYQSMMGDIQDVEVLLETFEKFVRKEEVESKSAAKLRSEFQHRRKSLIRVYLNAANSLGRFWPPPGLAPAQKGATVVAGKS